MKPRDTYSGSNPDDGFDTTTITTTLDDLDQEDFVETIITQYPDLEEYIRQLIEDNPDMTATELLAAIQSYLEDTEDPRPVTINITTKTGTLFLNQVRDLAFSAERQIRIELYMNNALVLDNLYKPSFDGLVHLDLQELVQANTVNYLPTICPEDDAVVDGLVHQYHTHATIYAVITHSDNTRETFLFQVLNFESGAAERCTDIDFLRVPKDYLLPLAIYMTPGEQQFSTVAAYLESGQRRTKLNEGRIDIYALSDSSYIVSKDVILSTTPARANEHVKFRLVMDGRKPTMYHHGITTPEEIYHREVTTPTLMIVNGEFEQYIFLNKYGRYENIPMSGAKTFSPEYTIENASRAYSIEKVSATKKNLWIQNTGPQTRATLTALSELLLSPEIFHYIPGESLKRIIIENPSLVINSKNNIHTATFSWRYVTK